MDKNQMIWGRLRLYLPEDMEGYVLGLFDSCFDYSVPRPWDHVIAELVTIIQWRAEFFQKNIKIVQAKIKFGGLRFYIDGDKDDYLYGAIKMAEIECSKICPHCASYNKTKLKTGRFTTKCLECKDVS